VYGQSSNYIRLVDCWPKESGSGTERSGEADLGLDKEKNSRELAIIVTDGQPS